MNQPTKSLLLLAAGLLLVTSVPAADIAPAAPTAKPPVTLLGARPLSLEDALNLSLHNNPTILKARKDVEAAQGISIQTKAIAIPKVQASSFYGQRDRGAVESYVPGVNGNRNWDATVRLVQSVYEGGKIQSGLRTSRLTREQAVYDYTTVVMDTLVQVRVAYYDVLEARQQIVVRQASLELLQHELSDQTRRFDAGTVPRFNVLRAEVEVANARPPLIRARNALRIAKNNLVNLVGFDVPKDTWEDLPLELTGTLEAEPQDVALPKVLSEALQRRTEILSLQKAVQLRGEDVKVAKAGHLPKVDVYAGFDSHSSVFTDNLSHDITGWIAGAELSWDIFDGNLTKGKVVEAKARHDRARLDITDTARRIELEVRTAYSNFIEAKEVLESQKKVQEQAEEALRLASARSSAGTGTQLDVLSAQTALTEARTTQIQAQHDYVVARARLERAIGLEVTKIESPTDK